jgi:hypothetical protein
MLTRPGLFIDLSVVHELVQPRLPIKLGTDSVADPVASVRPRAEQGTARTQSGGEEDFGGFSGQIEEYILQLRASLSLHPSRMLRLNSISAPQML